MPRLLVNEASRVHNGTCCIHGGHAFKTDNQEGKSLAMPTNPPAKQDLRDKLDILVTSSHLSIDEKVEAVSVVMQAIDKYTAEAELTERIERLNEMIKYRNDHFPLMADDTLLGRLYEAKRQLRYLQAPKGNA